MYSVTKNIGTYVKNKGVNLSKMARDTGIPYSAIYSSLCDEDRNRDLRAGELKAICDFLGKNPMDFWDEE